MIFNIVKSRASLIEFLLFISIVLVSCNDHQHGTEWDIRLIPVEIGNKWGYIDFKGNLVIEPRFERADHFAEGLARVLAGNAFGFIDEKGKFVIQPNHLLSGNNWFSEGLWRCFDNKKLSTIFYNKSGEVSKEFMSSEITDFHSGLAGYRKVENTAHGLRKSEWGFIDKEGTLIIDTIYKEVGNFYSGLAPVIPGDETGRKIGYINIKGEKIIDYIYGNPNNPSLGVEMSEYDFKNEYANVQLEGFSEVVLIDTKGNVINEEPKHNIDKLLRQAGLKNIHQEGRFRFGLAPVKQSDGKWGFANETGVLVIEPIYNSIDWNWNN
jgi:WG containing repeat